MRRSSLILCLSLCVLLMSLEACGDGNQGPEPVTFDPSECVDFTALDPPPQSPRCTQVGVSASPTSWASCVGGVSRDDGHAVAVGLDGSVYLGFGIGGPDARQQLGLQTCYQFTPEEASTIDFLGTPIPVSPGTDPGIAKFTREGVLQWVQTAPGDGLAGEVRSVVVDPVDGAVFVAGDFSGTAAFDPAAPLISAHQDLFVAEYGPDGNLIWARTAMIVPDPDPISEHAGNTHADAHGIDIDPVTENIVVVGEYTGLLTFGQFTIQALGSTDAFVAELSKDGTVLWLDDAGGQGDASGAQDVTIEPDGSVMVVGSLGGSHNEHITGIDGQEVLMPSYAGEFGTDMVLVHYFADGRVDWATHAGYPAELMYGTGAGHDAAGNVYVTGVFTGCALFRRQPVLVNTPPPPPLEGQPPCADSPVDMALLAPGGPADTEQFVAKYTESGLLQWVRRAGGSGADFGAAVEVFDPGGFFYVGGHIEGTAIFGDPLNQMPTGLPGQYAHSIARYDLNGGLQWVRSVGSEGKSQLYDIAVDPTDGGVVGAGAFNGVLSFPSGITLQSASSVIDLDDIVIWRFGQDGL